MKSSIVYRIILSTLIATAFSCSAQDKCNYHEEMLSESLNRNQGQLSCGFEYSQLLKYSKRIFANQADCAECLLKHFENNKFVETELIEWFGDLDWNSIQYYSVSSKTDTLLVIKASALEPNGISSRLTFWYLYNFSTKQTFLFQSLMSDLSSIQVDISDDSFIFIRADFEDEYIHRKDGAIPAYYRLDHFRLRQTAEIPFLSKLTKCIAN
jgi:hypothetical protein